MKKEDEKRRGTGKKYIFFHQEYDTLELAQDALAEEGTWCLKSKKPQILKMSQLIKK
jgi:5-formyltetrahydrofolate cyclo-ligase